MSHFEYVSVAVALIYSLAIARLLGGLPHTSAKSQGSAVALLWNIGMILGCMTSWWVLWRFKDIAWNPLAFVWVVAVPGFAYLQAAILLTDTPGQVDSWESQFWAARRRFFSVGLMRALHAALLPWVAGALEWFTPAPVHAGTLVSVPIFLIALWSESRRVHLTIGCVQILLPALFILITPTQI